MFNNVVKAFTAILPTTYSLVTDFATQSGAHETDNQSSYHNSDVGMNLLYFALGGIGAITLIALCMNSNECFTCPEKKGDAELDVIGDADSGNNYSVIIGD